MAKDKKHNKRKTEEEDYRLIKKPKKTVKTKRKNQSNRKVDPDNWEDYLE